MKKSVILIMLIFALAPYAVLGQLKSQDKPTQIKQEIIRSHQNQYLGLSIFDPSKFSMSHSFSMSYFSVGGKGVSQGLYLNTLSYQIANPLLLRVQWGIQNYPYNSLAKNHPAFQSGFFLSGAELQYKPSDKLEMSLQFNSMPNYMYNSYLYDSPFRPYRSSMWNSDEEK
jgi:hypothetical protein